MAKKKPGTPRPKRKCPHCQKTKLRSIKEELGGVTFVLLVCDNAKCKSILGGGPVTE